LKGEVGGQVTIVEHVVAEQVPSGQEIIPSPHGVYDGHKRIVSLHVPS